MFKLNSIHISGFWQKRTATASFRDDVNIIIGRNGTGKTTFMNIVQAVLTVDVDAIYDNFFDSVTIMLTEGKKKRTIRADRIDPGNLPFPIIEYHISNHKFSIPLVSSDGDRGAHSPSLRRRAAEEAHRIRQELSNIVAIASLSVYRTSGEADPDFRERLPRRHVSTVDQRLMTLTQRLTQYQLELSNAAREISTQLQRDVLTSLLYTEDKKSRSHGYNLNYDEATEKKNLILAYKQLGVGGSDVAKKIQNHISAVGKAINNVHSLSNKNENNYSVTANFAVDFAALEASKLIDTVVAKSLSAEKRTKELFSQLDLFFSTLRSFITEKSFFFRDGELAIESKEELPLSKLSSGEKQLLILFIEALLQRQRPYIFLADEPELSLHIAWQKNILTATRLINPNAQIVVATHSPEIAGKFRNCILDMENILHA